MSPTVPNFSTSVAFRRRWFVQAIRPSYRAVAGYRIYLGRDGQALVVLLAGGTKSGQNRDIEKARRLWREYKHHKRRED